ncbi:MAG: hypothetical protein A3F91_02225 [Flavobacteria bacterium RIFCSPLOWO2_12_FULL_35_11]|nr:MAG: hypothetical protein A3F91_02225 [Flavobacteria bacterium RIFCSPLOWO2_12_FULL_35_11]
MDFSFVKRHIKRYNRFAEIAVLSNLKKYAAPKNSFKKNCNIVIVLFLIFIGEILRKNLINIHFLGHFYGECPRIAAY